MSDVYLNNPFLKKANVAMVWQKHQIVEINNCKNNIEYFIENYMKIVNLDDGLVNFKMYPYQKKMVKTIFDNRFVIIKTPRQAGKTTTTAAIILWHILFNDEYAVGILANKLSTAREILGRVQRAYENLPDWLQQGVVEWNKTTIVLENGSQCLAASTASSAIRGFSINLLYLDEFCHVHRNLQDEFFNSVYPVIISGQKTKVVITSTPKGFDLFYKIWTNSVEGRNEYINFSVNWWDVPGRDEKWKKNTISNTSEMQFRQEFGAEFLGSSNTLIESDVLSKMVFINPIEQKMQGNLKIYEEPVEGGIYFMTCDTARGTGLDASAFIVIRVDEYPYKVVAVYKNAFVNSMFFPEPIYNVATAYNEAYVLIEINDNGQQVADILHSDLEYENVVFTAMKGRMGQQLAEGFGSDIQKGVRTTKQVKRIGCSNLKIIVENDKIMLNDYDLVDELSKFIVKGNSYEADYGHHDDLVMCLVLFSWSSVQNFFREVTDIDMRKRLSEERNKMLEDDMMPFGFIDDGKEDLPPGVEMVDFKFNHG